MAHKFFSSLDLNKCELKNHVLENLNSDPANPIEGHIYYNIADDKVKFYTNNSWNSFVASDSAGNVGIGTTSLSAPLMFGKSVYANPNSENFYRIKFQDQGGITNDVGIGQSGTGHFDINFDPVQEFTIWAGTNNERLKIMGSTGNVGIGTATPAQKLDVVGNIAASGDINSGGTININKSSADTSSTGFNVRKRGTTGDANAAVTSGTELGYHGFYGWDGTASSRGAYAISNATQNWTSSACGTSYGIAVTANGTTVNSLAFKIDQDKTATFYGGVVLPSATSIGNVSSTEVSYLDGVTSAIQTQFSGKANSSHTHAAGNITTGVLGNNGKIGLANHPEGGGLFTPSYDNDLAFIIDRGGAVSFYKTTDLTYTAQTLTNTGAVGFNTAIPFNGTTNYATTTLAATTDIVVCDITMPFSLSYSNTWYVDFGNSSWMAKDLSFYAYQSVNNLETDYKLVGTAIVNSTEHLKFTSGSYSHSKSPSGTGPDYNRLRIVMTNWQGLSPRIAAIGARFFNSPGLSTTLLGLGGGTMYGSVKLNNLTASQTLETDASKNVISAAKQTGYNLALSTTATDIKVNGTQSLGSLSTLARADHVHPVYAKGSSISRAINDAEAWVKIWSNNANGTLRATDFKITGTYNNRYNLIEFRTVMAWYGFNHSIVTKSITNYNSGTVLQIRTNYVSATNIEVWVKLDAVNATQPGTITFEASDTFLVNTPIVEVEPTWDSRSVYIDPKFQIDSVPIHITCPIIAPKVMAGNSAGLALYEDGGQGIFIKDGGNVGIGTVTPAQKLDVVGKISLKDAGDSIFVGFQAGLNDDASANLNVGVGYQALYSNTAGGNNSAVGYQALYSNTTGVNNVAVGRDALLYNTVSNQTAVGYQALRANTTGANNTAHGYRALHNNTTVVATLGTITGGSGYIDNTYTSVLTYVSGSTAVTYPTATIVVSGGVVTTVTLTSFGVGFKDTTTVLSAAAANIGGTGSGFTVPVATISSGENNTAIGLHALYSNTTGDSNTATGLSALFSNTTGANNSAVGVQALYSNTTASNNTAIGLQALYYNTTGASNTANGFGALYNNTTGASNSADGSGALYSNTTASNNTAIGTNALFSNTTGSSNTAIGREAGRFIADGTTANTVTSNSVFLGHNTKALAISQTNQIVIGDTAVGLGSNTAILGNSSITKTQLQGNVGIGTATPGGLLALSGSVSDTALLGATAGATSNALFNLAPSSDNIVRYGLRLSATGNDLNLDYRKSTDGSPNTAMTIQRSSGNVGIGTATPLNKLDIVGSLGRGAPVTKTTDFTVAATENWLIMNGTATITITLPTASSFTGRELMIKNIAAYTVISASSNVKPIDTDTAATAILPATAGSWCTLVSDGTNWVTMMN